MRYRRSLARRFEPHPDEQSCRSQSRASRAVEGAALGAIVGLVGGAILGGLLRVTSSNKDSKAPLVIGLSIIGVGAVGQAIVAAAPPEC